MYVYELEWVLFSTKPGGTAEADAFVPVDTETEAFFIPQNWELR